jgi:flagellar basal body-associated protein FliL
MAQEKKRTDIWLLVLVIVLVAAAGASMWFFSVAIGARFDETNARIKGRSAQIMTAVINLRQDILTRFPANTAVETKETAPDAKSPDTKTPDAKPVAKRPIHKKPVVKKTR